MSRPKAASPSSDRPSGGGKFMLDLVILIVGYVPVTLGLAAAAHYALGWGLLLSAVAGTAVGVPLGGRLAHRIQQALESS